MLHSGVLRTARLEVASHLPDIAPDLEKHPDAVLRTLQEVVMRRNIDPCKIKPLDWNKTERHVYTTFGFDQMSQGFIEGDGYAAHFIDPRPRRQKIVGNPLTLWGKRRNAYQRNLVGMMICRRDEFEREFTDGATASRRWWPYAFARHAILGRQLVESAVDRKNISDEARSLKWALAGSSLAHFMQEHARFIGKKRDNINLDHRVQAAHDLIRLPLALAGMNSVNIQSKHRIPLPQLDVEIFFDRETRQYNTRRHHGDNWADVFYRGEFLETATLKCPVHTPPLDDLTAPSRLKTTGHAAINMGEDYGLFRYQDPLLLH